MLKIVTIVNKPDVYSKGLRRSLSEQRDVEYDLLEISNENNQFKSLYLAYQSVMDRLSLSEDNDFIMFCHPDIAFLNSDELSRMYNEVQSICMVDPKIAVLGVAGALFGDKHKKVSTIVHGDSRVGNKSQELLDNRYIEVQTVDACCFFVKTSYLKQYGFDSTNDCFHMLIEEYSIRLFENGVKTVVIPADIWHFSPGSSLDYSYYLATKRIVKKHREIKYINTTSFHWVNSVLLPLKLDFYALRNYVHHRIIRR